MDKRVYADLSEVAEHAAQDAISTLQKVIHDKGSAVWMLAGGSSPMLAYKNIVDTYADALDWSKVTLLIGDERCVPIDHKDSNWGQIAKILLVNEHMSRATQLIPSADLGPDLGAREYSRLMRIDLSNERAYREIDLLWLGVGEDGHTLSLFPGNSALHDESNMFVPVYDSPKPPSERISLSMKRAAHAKNIVIFATGANKHGALMKAEKSPKSVPIGLLAASAVKQGANVMWLFDNAAANGSSEQ